MLKFGNDSSKNFLLHGGDYNPDQWLDRPDILADDILFMKKAHINTATLGVFAWSVLEPKEGEYNLAWLHDIIDNLYENGIKTILATPSGAKPFWLSETYEEVRRVNRYGVRELSGNRHNHCPSSPVFRQKTTEIDERLSEKFGRHPGVIAWHISNEFGGECFCPHCVKAFRGYLQDKYKSLDALNKQWWSAFWSHTYTDWDQIHPPFEHGDSTIHGLMLDWKRFTTNQTISFMNVEAAAVRKHSSLPVTTNFMEFYNGLNYFKFAPHVDFVSWDSYPSWHWGDDFETGLYTAMAHDLMRSVKHEPFLLMESTPSTTNWQSYSKLKKPGMHTLASLQAVAHGSDGVCYFQWRRSRGASEKFHGSVMSNNNRCDTRVFADVEKLGGQLETLSQVAGAPIHPDVAIVYDWENKWGLEGSAGPRNIGIHYIETVLDHYAPLRIQGIDVDFIDCESDAFPYKLIIAPLLYMYRADIGDKLQKFVQNGGILVGTYHSGVVNENDLAYLGDCPAQGMTDVFGIRAEEIDCLTDTEYNTMDYDGKEYKLTQLCERIHIIDGKVEKVSSYKRDFYKGEAVVTRNAYGSGSAYYIAARPEREFLSALYQKIAKELGIETIPCNNKNSYAIRRADKVFTLDFYKRSVRLKG